MKKFNLFFFLLAALALASCGGDAAKTAETTPVDSTAQQAPPVAATSENCYIHAVGKDTTWLTLKLDGENVSGKYHWHPFEKDGGHGTIAGKNTGGMLDVIFDYTIEGSSQKEQKIFKLEGDKVMEMEGELEDKDGVLRLKDPSKPSGTIEFVKGACNTVD